MSLTDTAIRQAKASNKVQKLYDAGGFYLEAARSGGKWWRFKYRFGDKKKSLSFGVYPDVSLKDARARRDEMHKLLANEVDPGELRKAKKAISEERNANSFEMVARGWFARHSPNWAANHSNRTTRRLERDIFPWIGNKAIADTGAPELLVVVRRIEERGALETSHRALQNCGQVFRYAIATGRAIRDPSADLRGALPLFRGTHFAAVTEPAKVAEILRMFGGYGGTLTVRCARRLAPLLFVRPGELRHALWADIDLDAKEWRDTVTKTRTEHIVPLARQAVDILRELQPLSGRSEYVFPSARSAKRPMSDNAILAAMRRMGIGKDEMSGHEFRAMARTIIDEVLGVRPDFIERQLAHAVRDPNGRAYNRTTHLPERRKMMQEWADYRDKLRQYANTTCTATTL
jgi:integrase